MHVALSTVSGFVRLDVKLLCEICVNVVGVVFRLEDPISIGYSTTGDRLLTFLKYGSIPSHPQPGLPRASQAS